MIRAGLWPVWVLIRTWWLAWLQRQMSPADMRQPELILERRQLEAYQ